MFQAEAILHTVNGETRDRGSPIFIEKPYQVKCNPKFLQEILRSYALFVNIVANPYTANNVRSLA
jgi:hypothetical protein